jgi:hypothetical protein
MKAIHRLRGLHRFNNTLETGKKIVLESQVTDLLLELMLELILLNLSNLR